MSFSKPIPKKLRDEMEQDPFYQACCLSGKVRSPKNKIEWHHAFITYQYGNKGRLNEKWCIIPLLKEIHDKEKITEVRDLINWIILNRASDETLKKYSKCLDLIKHREYLNSKYGEKKDREKIIAKYI